MLALTVLGAALLSSAAAAGQRQNPTWERDGHPKFGERGGEKPARVTRTIPYWSASFTDPMNGVTYPFTMVGADPRTGTSTTVPTEIIPIRFNFVAGRQNTQSLALPEFGYPAPPPLAVSMDATGHDVAQTVASPIFQAYTHPSILGGDTTQAGDAFMRAQFGKGGSGYHVLLGQPQVPQTVSIDVPQRQGVAVINRRGVLVGRVDVDWFSKRIDHLMDELGIDPATLPIFLTHDVVLYAGNDYSNCCIIGYHGASRVKVKPTKPIWTYVYAAYLTPKTFGGWGTPVGGLADIHALSHEVSEWLDDPFTNNVVNPWLAPSAPQYGCTNLLETGDPVVGVWYPLAGNADAGSDGLWHPEDEAFLNWFARNGQDPSLGSWDGRYTFMGPLTTGIDPAFGDYSGFRLPAQGC